MALDKPYKCPVTCQVVHEDNIGRVVQVDELIRSQGKSRVVVWFVAHSWDDESHLATTVEGRFTTLGEASEYLFNL